VDGRWNPLVIGQHYLDSVIGGSLGLADLTEIGQGLWRAF